MPHKLFSFFSGSGFLDLGFEKNGYETVFVNEYHQPFLDAYIHSRKKLGIGEPAYGYDNTSIEEIYESKKLLSRLASNVKKEQNKGDLVGFIGGPPCPDFSVGGKNKGRNGENGKLTKTYSDVICASKPDFFLFENVKGLWRTSRHRDFYEEIKSQYKQSGYVLIDRLTNCLEFGAPQDRDRIILMGFHESLLKSLNINTEEKLNDALNWEKHLRYDLNEVMAKSWPDRTPFTNGGPLQSPSGIPIELTVQHWFDKNRVTEHPNSKHHFVPRAALPRFQTIDEGDDGKKSFKRLHRWRYSPTAAYGNNEVHIHPFLPRRISAAEALSIQSLPREFELPADMSLSNMFKTIGNGVPYLMAAGIARIMYDFITETECIKTSNEKVLMHG